MQFPSDQVASAKPINFVEKTVAGVFVKQAWVDEDIIIQIYKGTKFPEFAAQRTAKALIDTVGEPAMEQITIENLKNEMIEGGQSVYVRCKGMNTAIIKNIMFPRFYQCLEETMQAP